MNPGKAHGENEKRAYSINRGILTNFGGPFEKASEYLQGARFSSLRHRAEVVLARERPSTKSPAQPERCNLVRSASGPGSARAPRAGFGALAESRCARLTVR